MNNLLHKYQSVMGQLNYTIFLVLVALLPFPQIFLRYTCTAWLLTWLLEGRFMRKPTRQDWQKAMPFLMFGAWYLWKIISGLWADNIRAYNWQLDQINKRQVHQILTFGILSKAEVNEFLKEKLASV